MHATTILHSGIELALLWDRLGLAVTADELYEARLSGKEERPNVYICNALLNALASDCSLAFERYRPAFTSYYKESMRNLAHTNVLLDGKNC